MVDCAGVAWHIEEKASLCYWEQLLFIWSTQCRTAKTNVLPKCICWQPEGTEKDEGLPFFFQRKNNGNIWSAAWQCQMAVTRPMFKRAHALCPILTISFQRCHIRHPIANKRVINDIRLVAVSSLQLQRS